MFQSRGNVSPTLTGVAVTGFKSLVNSTSVEVAKLTILAGANSAGKSSLFQPLLLLKQTLESSFDPGPLLLNGPNVKFTSSEQLFSKTLDKDKTKSDQLEIIMSLDNTPISKVKWLFKSIPKIGITLAQLSLFSANSWLHLTPDLKSEEIDALVGEPFRNSFITNYIKDSDKFKGAFSVIRQRCFFDVVYGAPAKSVSNTVGLPILNGSAEQSAGGVLANLIHLPGLRGNPTRTYPVTAVGETFVGNFNSYVASVISDWQVNGKHELDGLSQDLQSLGLTWKVAAHPVNETEVELRVGRLVSPKRGGAKDLVNIADVGFGLSQTLPVVVALHVAKPGQTVYVEQPEIHLHPRAQVKMAEVLIGAARRGVRVVAETHSSLLILALQTIVAKGQFNPDDLLLHWLTRDEAGSTRVSTAKLDQNGAYGEWPTDFGDVALTAEERYLAAVGFANLK